MAGVVELLGAEGSQVEGCCGGREGGGFFAVVDERYGGPGYDLSEGDGEEEKEEGGGECQAGEGRHVWIAG